MNGRVLNGSGSVTRRLAGHNWRWCVQSARQQTIGYSFASHEKRVSRAL